MTRTIQVASIALALVTAAMPSTAFAQILQITSVSGRQVANNTQVEITVNLKNSGALASRTAATCPDSACCHVYESGRVLKSQPIPSIGPNGQLTLKLTFGLAAESATSKFLMIEVP